MRLVRCLAAVLTCLVGVTTVAAAQTPSSTVFAEPRSFEKDVLPTYISEPDGVIRTPSEAGELINLTLKKLYPTQLAIDDRDFYCIVHVVRWTDPKDAKQKVESQHWYLYHPGQDWTLAAFTTDKRLFGVKRAWLLMVHLNVMKERVTPCLTGAADCMYHPRYDVFVKEKLPANAAHLAQLFTLVGLAEAEGTPPVTNVWGGGPLSIDKDPSDVTIQPKMFDGTNAQTLGDPQTFDNEGRHWWDVSFGVPIRAVKELTIDQTAGTAVPAEIEKQRLFVLFDFFVPPIDLKANGLYRIPHIVAGVGFAKRPLDRVLVAAGWGPAFANFYIGAVFVRSPKEVDPDQKYEPQFAIGVNLPVRAIAEKLKKQK